jgi:peptide/nickel transport system substrate-binding protein
MHEEDSRAPDAPVTPCGHLNPPNAYFCDVCGVKLPVHCPRCHAINRSQANFCVKCGSFLHEARRAHATPSMASFGAAPDSSPAAEAESASGSASGWMEDEFEDSSRFEQLKRFLQTSRRVARPWMWVGLVSVTMGVLGGALIHTYLAAKAPLVTGAPENMSPRIAQTPPASTGPGDPTVQPDVRAGGAEPPPAVNTGAMAPRLTGAPENMSPGVAQSPPASSGPGDPTIQPGSRKPPAPRTPEESPAAGSSDARAGGAEPPSEVNTGAKAPLVTGAPKNMSPGIAQSPPASTGSGDRTVQSGPGEQPPAPRTPEKSPAAAPSAARGGELTFVVSGEPPSYDAHREETFALIHPAAPHYNTLLRIDPLDQTGTRVVGDLATSWTVSSDRRTYVLKLRRGVKFHDGSEMTSRDVRATYEKIINPPPGITSARKGEYLQIETVQAPEPYIVAFKLKWPSPSFIHSLASPWNWIYKADILERDIRWYEKNIMGTGPFIFVEHVKGSHWVGWRNPQYWDRGKPYLDGYQALFIRDDAAQVAAIRSGRAHIQFRGFSPAQRDDIVHALGEKIIEQTSPWNCALLVAINHEKWPLQDPHVRRALSLALDRYSAVDQLSKTTIVREVAGVQLPGSPFATPPAELKKLAGYRRDIGESRSEARRLLADAGVPDGFSLVLKNRDIAMPYQHIGAWLVDEWRQIGLNVRHEIHDSAQYFKDLRDGNFELSIDFQCGYVVDPDLDLYKFQSRGRSDANYGRYTDPVLDDLYVLQSRTVNPKQRRRHIRAFEKRLLDEEAHYIYTLQWNRIVPHSSQVRGWTITPSHYLNNQLDMVWLEN